MTNGNQNQRISDLEHEVNDQPTSIEAITKSLAEMQTTMNNQHQEMSSRIKALTKSIEVLFAERVNE